MKKLLWLFSMVAILGSCEWLEENAPAGLSDEEIIEGLKTALTVGTDSSSTTLSLQDGYYGNSLVKIPLPEEAVKVQNQIKTVLELDKSGTLEGYLNFDQQFEKVVQTINRAAEESAKEAAPIFKDAITELTISEGWDILNGIVPGGTKSTEFDSTAATQYLMSKTYSSLTDLYAPKIDIALDKELILGLSANQAWSTLRTTYNATVNTLNSFPLNLALEATGQTLDPIETETIGVFATEKALDGLFYMVGEEEKEIRRNPFEWALDIIQKVFGFIQ